MARFSSQIIVALVVDVALLLFLCLHIPNLFHRAGAPFTVSGHSPSIQIDEILDPVASDGLRPNDILLTWGDRSLSSNEEVEFLADFHEIQDRIPVRYQHEGITLTTDISLIPYYGISYIISIYLVGLITWCVGVFVLLRKGDELGAKILHWAMISMAVVVMSSW